MKRTMKLDDVQKAQIAREWYLIENHFLNKIKYFPKFVRLPNDIKAIALGNTRDLNKSIRKRRKAPTVPYTIPTDPNLITATFVESEQKIKTVVDGIQKEIRFVAEIDNKVQTRVYPRRDIAKPVKKVEKPESKKSEHIEDEGVEDCLFIQILDRYLCRHLERYEYFIDNAGDNNFDLVHDFIKSFERNCFDYVFYKTQSAAFDERDRTSDFDDETYIEKGEAQSMENEIDLSTEPLPDIPAEQYPDRERATAKLNSLRVDFDKYLNFVEHKIFMNMIKRTLTFPELSTAIGTRINGQLLTEQKIRTILNKIQFRFNCFMILRKFLNPELGLQYLNEMPRLCNKYFRNHRLSVLPTDERLRFVIEDDYIPSSYGPRPTYSCIEIESAMRRAGLDPVIPTHGRDFIYSSRTDFGEKVHKHAVVYVKASGWAYDHVTGDCKDLMKNENEEAA